MSNEVRLVFTAEDKYLQGVIEKQGRQIERLQEKMHGVGRVGRDSFSHVGKELQSVALGLIGPSSVGAAVMTLVSQVKAAYDTMKQQHRQFMTDIQQESDAKSQFLWNAPAFTKDQAQAFAERGAAEAGVTRTRIYQIGAEAFSAGGGLSQEAIESAIIEAARMERRGVGDAKSLVGAALDVSKATGLTDPQANLAFIKQIGSASRVTELQNQMKLTPGLLAGTQAGLTAEQAGELSATLGNIGTDTEGSETSTAMVRFMQAVAKEELVPTVGEGGKMTWGRLQGATQQERLEELQKVYQGATPEQQSEIQSRIGGRGRMVPAIEAVLLDNEIYRTVLEDMRQKIAAPGSSEAMGQWDTLSTNMESGLEGVVSGKREAEAVLTNLSATRGDEATGTAQKDLLLQYMEKQGASGALLSEAYKWGGKASWLTSRLNPGAAAAAWITGRFDAPVRTEEMAKAAKTLSPDGELDQRFFAAIEKIGKAAESLENAATGMTQPRPPTRQELD